MKAAYAKNKEIMYPLPPKVNFPNKTKINHNIIEKIMRKHNGFGLEEESEKMKK